MQPRTLPRGRAAVLRAVTGCRGRREEQALHCLVCKLGLASDVVLATALLVRYGKRGLLGPAQRLFDEMRRRDAVAFNAMLAALGASGRAADARRLFDRMPERDRTPASWNTLLTCYCRAGDLASARTVFEASLRAATSSVVSWNAMVDGYCKAGRMDAARELFDRMGSSLRDVITYNTMMAGYLRRGDPAAAIAMFRRLAREEEQTLRPTAVTIATVVTACTQVGDFAFGRAVHLSTRQLLGTSTDAVLSNALMDMYFKCGSVDRALEVFSTMPGAPNLFCWNTVIAGLGRNGRGEDAVRAFRDMVQTSKKINAVKPDSVTFVALLSACSHSGLVREGRELFAEMLPAHGVAPGAEHYGCMVDLLCRAGLLGEAVQLVRTMPVRPNAKVLGCLLLHARSSGDGVTASEWAARRIVELDVRDGAAYGLSNLYASLQRWDHVERHRSAAVASGKEPGRTSYDPQIPHVR
ncbi:pentatricopeptide repeat-containing protein At3g29230-like [Triticum dicoccoides]|uniref:pentatricopeptide repeat-containing protein At3g29230-like n=1 Tax=Triticum dicoccoides TaxID=85692 RepID=UPI000E793B25|nr:pentatricopeptide repeat-containing protein At3g29230-like [Triticum dicoccoides]